MRSTLSRVILILMLFYSAGITSLFGQETLFTTNPDSDYITIPVNVSWFPGFSIGESIAGGRKIINLFSLNILAGNAAKLRGVEFGSVWNNYTEDIQGIQLSGVVNNVEGTGLGFQAAGVFNRVGGSFLGFQTAGVMNFGNGPFEGVQASGAVNFNRDEFTGAQLAGAVNLMAGSFRGLQSSGAVNWVLDDFDGVQLAGAVNIATRNFHGLQAGGAVNLVFEDYTGVQMSGAVNVVGGRFNGVQVAGAVNIAKVVDQGLQIGVVNIADEHHGLPIGMVTVVRKNMYVRFELSGSEVFHGRIAFKLGLPYFYNIYSLAKLPGDGNRWAYGFGFGSEKRLSRSLTLNVEASTNQELWIDDDRVRHFLHIDRLHLLNQLSVTFGFHLIQIETSILVTRNLF